MQRPRFQFTLKRLLLATLWIAICFGGVVANRSIAPEWDFHGPKLLFWYLRYVTFYAPLISPFIAIGALFGRSMTGAIVGFIAAAVFILVISSLNLIEILSDPTLSLWQRNDLRNQFITLIAVNSLMMIVGVWVFLHQRRRQRLFP
jgi:hypothetical protein